MLSVLTNKKHFWMGSIALCLFLSCGQNVISVDPAPPTTTVQEGNIELAEDLDTPLHRAILGQADLDYIIILLQSIDVNQPGNYEETALHLASERGDPKLIAVLLAHQADVKAKNIKGETPLHLAALCGKSKAIQVLLAKKAAIEAKSNRGRTPLHLAALAGQSEAIQVLLANQATIETKDNRGCTPLHLAAFAGKSEAVQVLLANQAVIEMKSNKDRTPLHLAALAGQFEAVQLLINHQAPVDVIDHKGRTPYDLAEIAAVKQLLERHMDLDKLIFRCDYENIGKRIVDYLTAKGQGKLRATCISMGWKLFQQGVHLQVTSDKLQHLHPYLYPRLYPHALTPHCVCPTFEPIPVEVVVEEKKHVRDWINIVQDKRFLIKNALYKGNIYQWNYVRAVLPEHLSDSIFLPEETRRTYEEIQSTRKPVHADNEQGYSDDEQIYSDNEQVYSDNERKSAATDTREAAVDISYLLASSVESPSSLAPEATFDNPYLFSHSLDRQLLPKESEASSENPYLFYNLPDPQLLLRESRDPKQEEITPDNPYLTTKLADEPDIEVLAPAEQEYSDYEGEPQGDQKEATDSQEIIVVDPGNQLYNSFVGVKKLPAGKVTIEKYLAAGAFGKVYRGQWDNKVVALKQIDLKHAATKLELTSEEVEEAMQWEVARLSTVSHPNLVQFYGLYQPKKEDYTYLVMEFCDGGTLQGALEKATVPWSQRWQWALQISEGLAYLHQEGVLHRDLKAENVLLDKNGRAKLADLGVAQVDALLQKEEASVVAVGLQDKRFIAPEVEADQTLSTKETDIYALGLVFWQIASGKEPRKIEDLNLYRRVDWHSGRERETIPADCPESFKKLILECWAKEPSQRPTAQDVVAKLAALGPELDPYHHSLVHAAQKLEQIVHPKRKEGLAYVAPFVTQYSVDESIETYWSRVEAAKAKEGATQSEAAETKKEANANPPLTLAETFKEFLEAPNSNTLLLLGEAGLGKTLTTYQWSDQLLKQWWAHVNTGTPAPAYFPLFIRPELLTWSHTGIKGAFQEVAKKYNLPKGIQPLVFIDGYDELQLDAEPTNLVKHLGFSEVGHAKLIVTCRSNTVERSAQKSRFGFNGALTTRYFLPFSLDQLLTYLQQEHTGDKQVYEDYQKTLASAESVRTVLRNPFVLHLFRESWETLSQRPLAELNRWQIYEGFIEHSIQSGKNLLPKKVRKRLKNNYSNLLTSYQAFMSTVAGQAFQQKAITLSAEETKDISPWADLPKYVEEVSKDEFAERKTKLQAEIDQAPEEKKAQLSRRSLLNEADYVSLNQKRLGQVEAELPLQCRGEHYEYSHKSLFEYGMAKRLLLLQHSPNIVEEGIGLLNSRKIQEEPEALQFWQEGWKESGSKALIEPLFSLIARSRYEEAIQQASANSATLLVQVQVAFSGRSLQGVRLSRADLSGALLSHTCLAGAQLPGAILVGAYLGHTDLRKTNLSNVDFGQGIRLECKHRVHCLSYHPLGTQLALGLASGNIELYNKEEEAYTPIATLKGHTGSVLSVCYRPDGQQLASGSLDNTVGLWDVHRQQLIKRLEGHTSYVNSITYRPDGQQLASGGGNWNKGELYLWDPHGHQLIMQLKGHTSSVNSVTYRPDGQQLASGSEDKTVGLWDPHAQQLISRLKGHTGSVNSVTYRPDGQQLASGSSDKTVGLWDPHAQQLISLLKEHNGSVMSVTYRPDGQQLASGSFDKTVGLWDPHRQQRIALLKGHTDMVNSVTYRPDGQQLASGNSDKTVGLWDPHRQQRIALLKGHTWIVNSVTYCPDGQQLASGSSDKTVGLWDPHRQQLISQLKGHTDMIWSVTYCPDGQQLASGSSDNTIGLWDPHRQQLISLLKGHTNIVWSVTYRPDGQQLASGSSDHTVGLWDPHAQKLISLLKGHTGMVISVTYRPDGQQLASGSSDNTIGLWDPHAQKLISLLKGHTGSVNSVTYCPKGHQLASGSDDNTVGIWDSHRQQLISLLKGHTGGVNSVTYRPDGQQLASASWDNTVGLWDPHRQQLISLLKGHTGGVNSVTYRPDGHQLASGSDDHAIFVWAKQDIAGLGQETWQLIYRFENTHSLVAAGALLKRATISEGSRALLKEKGANDTEDPQELGEEKISKSIKIPKKQSTEKKVRGPRISVFKKKRKSKQYKKE